VAAYWCILSTTTGRRRIWLTVSLPQPTSAVALDFGPPVASAMSKQERGWNSASVASPLLARRLGTVFRHLFNNCLTPNVLNITSKLFFSSGVTAPLSSFCQFLFSMFFVIACNALVALLAVSVVSYELNLLQISCKTYLAICHFCIWLTETLQIYIYFCTDGNCVLMQRYEQLW